MNENNAYIFKYPFYDVYSVLTLQRYKYKYKFSFKIKTTII